MLPQTDEQAEARALASWASSSLQMLAARSRLAVARKHYTDTGWLDRAFPNLHERISWLANHQSREAISLLGDYIELLEPYVRQRGLSGELAAWCEAALRDPQQLPLSAARLRLFQGQALYALGRWNEAEKSLRAAIKESEQADPTTEAKATLSLGLLQFNQSKYQLAFQTMASAQALLAQEVDFETWTTIRGEVAAYHLNRQELDTALSIYLEIDQLQRERGANESSDHTLLMLGVVYRKKKDYARAISYLQQLYKRAEERNTPSVLATSAHHLGWAYLEQGDVLQARHLCGKAILFYEQIGDTRGTADVYEQLGSIALAERNGQEALVHLQRALVMKQERESQQGAASCLRRIACAYLIMGRPGRALKTLLSSLWLYYRLHMLTWQRLIKILQEMWSSIVTQKISN